MKTKIENVINNFAPTFLVFVAVLILGFGCNTSKPVPDPLASFHWSSLVNLDNNKAITEDYKSYIRTLSPEERKYLGPSPISYFEDGNGQHAVEIRIGINGTVWKHVLIYDQHNKRIKTIKYSSGSYRS